MVHYKKKGFPSEGDLVICRVKNILSHCAFAELLEYRGKDGMIHISEVDSGWVKNIRNYLQENNQVVCKVIGIDKSKGHIDLSLKRVSSGERKAILSMWKLEKRMERLIEHIASQMDRKEEEAYNKVADPIVEKYGSLNAFYSEMLEKGTDIIKSLDIPGKWKDKLESVMEDQMKAHQVEISGTLELVSRESNGVKRIKKILSDLPDGDFEVNITYLGAPKYRVEVLATNYSIAESALSGLLSEVESRAKAEKVSYKWSR